MSSAYSPQAPSRDEIDAMTGAAVLDFGTNWCGYCRAAEPLITQALKRFPDVPHLKIEDGSGRPLGRSFGVKIWPTLIFLSNGREVTRLVRPRDAASITQALEEVDT